MSGLVSSDRIAALVEAARTGQLPEGAEAAAVPRHRQRLRSVDFSRPTKFTTDHQRRITRAVDTFCQTASTRLTAELRVPLELETVNTHQVTWSAAQVQLPGGAMCMSIDLQPTGTQMLLAAELPFLLVGLEILLGGSPELLPPERRLTEIDWALSRRLLESLVTQLAAPWRDLTGQELAPGAVDAGADAGRAIAVSEPMFVVEMESRINRHSSALSLLIPWVAIEPVAERVSGREESDPHDLAEKASLIGRSLAGVPVTVRAEVAATEMAVADILALKPGSVITFATPAERGITVYAENVRIGRAKAGSHGSRRAFQMTEELSEEEPA